MEEKQLNKAEKLAEENKNAFQIAREEKNQSREKVAEISKKEVKS